MADVTTPSFLAPRRTPPMGQGYYEPLLRTGEVVEILYPNNTKNQNRHLTEYTVLVQNTSGGHGTPRKYEHCIQGGSFGGLADRTSSSLRLGKESDKGFGFGAKVYLLCINGDSRNPVIFSGARDRDNRDDDDKEAEDHSPYLKGRFNGLLWEVDKEGQLTVTYTGKTGADGKRASSVKDQQVGTFLSFTKNGGFIVADKDAKNSIAVDHEHGKVRIARDKGFELGDATDKMLLGSSFRDAQKTLHDDLKQKLTQAATALTAAGGKVAGPFLAAAAGPDLINAATAILQAVQSIQAFEAKASAKTSFLSDKDKLG